MAVVKDKFNLLKKHKLYLLATDVKFLNS